MGIELPAELADIAHRTGATWPQADEDAMNEQAGAWRDAAAELSSLAGDADASAGGALDAMVGEAGDAARSLWAGFIDPDQGKLLSAAKGATQAADRLEHAALQIADAKVEMVRQLTHAARNESAATAAADGGHPTALLGIQNMIGAVSTNLASVNDALVGAVADTARTLDPSELVDPNPHSNGGRHGLVSAVTGLAAGAVDAGVAVVDSVPADAREAVDGVVESAGEVMPDLAGSGRSVVDSLTGTVAETAPDDSSGPAADSVWRAVPPAVEDVSASAPTPPSGLPGAHAGGSFAEAVTPRSGVPLPPGAGPGVASGAQVSGQGQTSLAGYADAPLPPGPAQQAPAAGPPLPGAGAAGAVPGVVQPGQVGGAHAPGVAGAPGSSAPADRAPARSVGRFGDAGGAQRPQSPEARQVAPAPQQPQPAVGSQRQDRQTVVALFLVHMFPIGHLPRAASRPARQLPPPPAEDDFAAGLRFEPHDHPDSAVIDTGAALSALGFPLPALADSSALTADDPVVEALLDGYDPLADMNERDWDRRYVVKPDESVPEYAWPPGERYPEGGYEDGEPVLLSAGTEIDRFGDPSGRVFAESATAYRKRSLPPAHLGAGYRRYRLLRELPMWRAVSAGWFGQPGSGVRLRAVYPARDLLVLGYLEDITAQASEQHETTTTGDGA